MEKGGGEGYLKDGGVRVRVAKILNDSYRIATPGLLSNLKGSEEEVRGEILKRVVLKFLFRFVWWLVNRYYL